MEKLKNPDREKFVDLDQIVDKARAIFRAYRHKERQRIMEFLRQKGPSTVTSVYTSLKLEQSVASQQLGILRKAHLVSFERDGKYILYFVNEENLKYLRKHSEELVHNVIKK